MSSRTRTLPFPPSVKRLFHPDPTELVEHYPNRAELRADRYVHMVGLMAAIAGGGYLAGLSWAQGRIDQGWATVIYAACLTLMLSCSAIYNLTRPSPARRLLRRLDEAAIFFLIAGSCTPFTTQKFHGLEAFGLTALVWSAAIAGSLCKVFDKGISEKVWCAIYIAFGWLGAFAVLPLISTLPPLAIALLAAGGVTYTLGVVFFLNPRLRFRRAIWHSFVVSGAAMHFGAVMLGVVMSGPA